VIRTLTKRRRPLHSPDELAREWQSCFAEIRRQVAQQDDFEKRFALRYGHEPRRIELDKFLKLFNPYKSFPMCWWHETLGMEDGSDWRLGAFNQTFSIRPFFNKLFSWSVPATEALAAIRDFVGKTPLVEYMAGTGYWSFLLRKKFGVRTFATDRNNDPDYACATSRAFMPVRTLAVESAKVPASCAAMLSWVPYKSEAADHLLKRMRSGQKLVWIGEGEGGCCATDSTFKILDELFDEAGEFRVPQFYGIHDYGRLLVRK
jgi:hypothetical protein